MPVKSIIDIEVNDEQFKAFSAMFEKYKAALGETPAGWKAVGDEIGKTGTTFEVILAAMIAQHELSKSIAEAEKEAAAAAEKKRKEEAAAARSGALHWKDMARTTRDVAGNIVRATTSLLKWSAITSAFTGLIGAGGLWGIDRMAAGVSAGRRSSQGLGLGYGAQRAFGVDYGSVVDSDSYLGAVNQALHSWSDKAGFFGAGMTPNEMHGDTAEVGSALLGHLKQIADNTNPAGLSDVMKARGLDRFVTLEDMMRLRAMSPEDFAKVQSRNTTDAKNLDLRKDTQNAWLSFSQQMERAGYQIENVFVKTLVKLEPGLNRLSEEFVHAVEAFSDSDRLNHWMDQLGTGLSKFAEYIGSPEFANTVDRAGKALGYLVDAVVWAGEKVGAVFHRGEPTPPGEKSVFDYKDPRSPLKQLFNLKSHQELKDDAEAAKWTGPFTSSSSLFSSVEKTRGLPPGILNALYQAESSSGRNLYSVAGAVGPLQFMPKTAAAYGVDPRYLDQSAFGAGHLLQDLLVEFKGDIAKTIAAYNWGAGHVETDVKQHGERWREFLPDETIKELTKVLGQLNQNSRTVVEIQNNSGGSVTAQASQVAR